MENRFHPRVLYLKQTKNIRRVVRKPASGYKDQSSIFPLPKAFRPLKAHEESVGSSHTAWLLAASNKTGFLATRHACAQNQHTASTYKSIAFRKKMYKHRCKRSKCFKNIFHLKTSDIM